MTEKSTSRIVRSTAKRIAQKLLGRGDVRGFLRTRQLWLSKKIHRRQVTVAELRQRLIDLGVTPGRTIYVHSSWNEFFNVPLRASEVIDLLRDLIGPNGTLAMPAFPIDPDPNKVFLVDKAPVYTGLLCEVFRRTADVRRSIHLSSSVCAIGPLHTVECLLYDEVPFFHAVFDGTIRYRWRRAGGETGEHEYLRRTGEIRPHLLRPHFGPEICVYSKISNLKMIAADAKPFIEHAVALGRRGITMFIQPVPKKELFVPTQRPTP
jgi:Aminoglycoside 3-N-acetyltransferase